MHCIRRPKFALTLALILSTFAAQAQLGITEVFPAASLNGNSAFHADWWELTNFGSDPVDVSGYRFNDSNGGLTNGVITLDALVLSAGESVVFFEQSATTGLPSEADFRTWWGGALPEGLRVFPYATNNIGLSGSGDRIRLWDSSTTNENDPVAGAEFGAATVGSSFTYDPGTGLFGTVSVTDLNGAVAASENGDIGSPGKTTGPVPLAIDEHPKSVEASPLSSVTFTVLAHGQPRPRYQWRRNDRDIEGATESSLVLTEVDATKTGTYRVTVRNGLSTLESDPAELTLSALPSAPVFDQKPSDATNFIGGTVTFSILATGVPPPAFRWFFADRLLEGEIGRTLVRSNLTVADAGEYRVEASNPSGTTNAFARLTVLLKPDLRVTEVESSAALDADFLTAYGFSKQDWWELTSFASVPISLLGWRFDDNSANLANAYTVTNDVVIRPGESVVFVENLTAEQFRTWWGTANVPSTVQIVSYSGSGFGLSSGGDSVRLWNATATSNADTVAAADFGPAEPGISFNYDPDTGVFGGKSVLGVHGVFAAEAVAAGGQDLGSPGRIREGALPPPTPVARVTFDAGKVIIEAAAVAGHPYQLQERSELGSGSWQNSGDVRKPSTDETLRWEVNVGGVSAGVYFQILVE
ncbi:MAG: lamin tail domain-containing protein [Verrucomicrobiales bacterium]|nr:lamin tail domain-containing protein [Verrucomicrobiales bacterium]